jgi:hypothetical protein
MSQLLGRSGGEFNLLEVNAADLAGFEQIDRFTRNLARRQTPRTSRRARTSPPQASSTLAMAEVKDRGRRFHTDLRLLHPSRAAELEAVGVCKAGGARHQSRLRNKLNSGSRFQGDHIRGWIKRSAR